MYFKNIKYLLFIIIGILFIIKCKKYPENNLWLKKPEKVFKGGKLTSYTVNGVDSFPMWDDIYINAPDNNGNGYKYDLRTAYFGYDFKDRGSSFWTEVGEGTLEFINKKKDVTINFTMDEVPGLAKPIYNIFLTKLSTWKILKLTKSGTLKIQRNYNNKIYELQIN